MRSSNFGNSLRKRKYLFHLHTNYTDGQISVEEYFAFAISHKVDLLVFLEHIRREPTYDWVEFHHLVRKHSEAFAVLAKVGFEAKILPSGDLDIPPSALKLADYVGIAEHAFPGDAEDIERAFYSVLERYVLQYPSIQFVWVHPGLWFLRRDRTDDPTFLRMIQHSKSYPILIEHNLRYGLPLSGTVGAFLSDRTIIGIDSHSHVDLERALSVLDDASNQT